jgi:hypothetical protein
MNGSVIDIETITDNDLYIDDDDSSQEQKACTDEHSLKNLSWFDSVEKELSSSIDTKMFMKNINNNKIVDINNLMPQKYKDLTDITILEHQTAIVNYLRKKFKSNDIKDDIDIDDILSKLNWLAETSKHLGEKIGLLTFHHKETPENVLARSSYKFCTYNFECQYNYNIKKHCGCFARHYVHNLVNADIEALIKYTNFNRKNLKDIYVNEIKKSINTISFVIGHMYDELQNALKFNFFSTNNLHMERTPKKKKQKFLPTQK